MFAGEILKYEALVEDEVYVSRSTATDPKVPAYEGGKFPLSTYLAARVRAILAEPQSWRALPEQVREWLEIQQWRSLLPRPAICWSRPSRAAPNIIWSAIRSRAGSRIRRSACC